MCYFYNYYTHGMVEIGEKIVTLREIFNAP